MLCSAFLYSQALTQPDLRACMQPPPSAVEKHYFQQVTFPQTHPSSNPLQKKQNNNLLFAIRWDLVIMSSQNDDERYKDNRTQQRALGMQLHAKGQGYINSSGCINSIWCCMRKETRHQEYSRTSKPKTNKQKKKVHISQAVAVCAS